MSYRRMTESRYMPSRDSRVFNLLRARRVRIRRQLDNPFTERLTKGIFHWTGGELNAYTKLLEGFLDTGTYNLTGGELAATRQFFSDLLSNGSFAFTAADLETARGYYREALGASYTFTGTDLDVKRSLIADLSNGVFDFTFYLLTSYVERITEELEAGQFTFTGSDLAVIRTLAPADLLAGLFAFTGSDLAVSTSYAAILNAATYSWTVADLNTEFSGALRGLTGGVDTRVLAGDEAAHERIVGYAT